MWGKRRWVSSGDGATRRARFAIDGERGAEASVFPVDECGARGERRPGAPSVARLSESGSAVSGSAFAFASPAALTGSRTAEGDRARTA